MTVFVLVHGGWHGGWCWRRVAARLRASGHEVHTPTLTGVGDRAHLGTPDTGLATHVEDVLGVLEIDDLRPHPVSGLADPLPRAPLPDLPRHFVHCADKPVPDVFAAFGAAIGSGLRGRLDVLDAGHDAMITAPDEVAALLVQD